MTNRKIISEATNGKLTSLTPISTGSGHKLNSEAAKAYEQMVAAAKADGVEWGITDSYRSLEAQNKIFDWEHYKQTKKRRKLGTAGTPAAYPGTSNHGWGAAIDLKVTYGDKAHTWLTNNASKFGFSNPFKNPRTEPWHWEHVASAKNLGSGTSPEPEGDETGTESGTTGTEGGDLTGTTSNDNDIADYSYEPGIVSNLLKIAGFNENDGSNQSIDTISEEIKRIKTLMK
jgi:hypothetical protein